MCLIMLLGCWPVFGRSWGCGGPDQNVPGLWPRTNIYIYIYIYIYICFLIIYFRSLGGSRPPDPPGWGAARGLGGGSPPTRGVWGAGAPQGAKNNIKYRPKASYAKPPLVTGFLKRCPMVPQLAPGWKPIQSARPRGGPIPRPPWADLSSAAQ